MFAVADGIDRSATVLICVTSNYMRKVNDEGLPLEACKQELSYAAMRKGPSRIIVAVMEPACTNPREWEGTLGFVLCDKLYTDLTAEPCTDSFDLGADRLVEEVRRIKAMKRHAK